MKSIMTFVAVVLAFSSFSVKAGFVWDWQFEDADLGVLQPTSVIQGRAIVSNSSDSTVTLDANSAAPRLLAAGLFATQRDGDFVFSIENGFGSQELFPWSNFTSSFFATTLEPGESSIFDFIWLKSTLPAGFAPGNYSVDAEIRVCLDECPHFNGTQDIKRRTLSWTIQNPIAVPEPATLLMLVCG